MYLQSFVARILDHEKHYRTTTYVDNNGNPVPSILAGHSIFSEDELAKLKEAERLIKEVRANYREEYFKMKPKIK